jgi:hypothetical protein
MKSINNLDYKFVRFGFLNHRNKQSVWIGNYKSEDKTFHKAPVSRGFYAFPFKYQEFFLIGVSIELQNTSQFKKNIKIDDALLNLNDPKNKELIELNSQIEQANYKLLLKNRREFIKTSGTIWCHFDNLPNNLILDRSGSWVKVEMKDWFKALTKARLQYRNNVVIGGWVNLSDIIRTKDSFEVFIDEKI